MPKDGGPAFPRSESQADSVHGIVGYPAQSGMTMRQYYAAKAMPAFINKSHPVRNFEWCAKMAFEMADAMLSFEEGDPK